MPPDPVPPAPEASQTAAPQMVSRRGLTIATLAALGIAAVIVVMGITTRKMADAKLREWTENQAVPVVAVALPDTRGKRTTSSFPAGSKPTRRRRSTRALAAM